MGLDLAKVRLGERLFGDVRVSHGKRDACITCHHLDNGGADRRDFSPSPEAGGMLDYNTPTYSMRRAISDLTGLIVFAISGSKMNLLC